MHDDLKQRLRDEVDSELGSRPSRNLPDVLTRGRSKRLALRLVTTRLHPARRRQRQSLRADS